MNPAIDLAYVASAMADPSRAIMLSSLLGGVALPAGELAYRARVSAPTASGHLARLVEAGLVVVRRFGRFRYYELAGPAVAELVEAMMSLSPRVTEGPRSRVPDDLRRARLCYDHLAGALGVGLADRLVSGGLLVLDAGDFRLTPEGERAFAAFGIDTALLRRHRRPLIRSCLDWSERRCHLAGGLGAALTRRIFELDWIQRVPGTRRLEVTPAGLAGFAAQFGLDPAASAPPDSPALP